MASSRRRKGSPAKPPRTPVRKGAKDPQAKLWDETMIHAISVERVKDSEAAATRLIWSDIVDDVVREVVGRLEVHRAAFPLPSRNREVEALVESEIARRVGEVIAFAETATTSAVRAAMVRIARIEAAWQVQVTEPTLPIGVSMRLPPANTLRGWVESAKWRKFGGDTQRPLEQWSKGISTQVKIETRKVVTQAFQRGTSVDEVIRDVRKATDMAARQAEAVTRTAMSHGSSVGAQLVAEENADTIIGVMWVSTLDSSTTITCFDGSTRVTCVDEPVRVFRRPYDGDLLVVSASGGKQLRCTPNHPILTARGWRAAKELNPGHDVIYSVSGDGLCVACRKDVGVPPSFSEVADAALDPSRSDVRKERSTAGDFHGDGCIGDDEVDVAGLDYVLVNAAQSLGCEHIGDHPLGWPDDGGSGRLRGVLSRLRGARPHVHGRAPTDMPTQAATSSTKRGVDCRPAPADGSPDFDRLSASVEQVEDLLLLLGAERACFAAAPAGDHPQTPEATRDRGRGDPVVPCQRCGALAVTVSAHDIVDVRGELGRSHVFNLETRSGVYLANGLVVHNCAALDGQAFRVDDGPRPPAHFNCRSRTTPLTRAAADILEGKTAPPTFDEIQAAAERRQQGTRPAIDYGSGRAKPVPATTTVGSWLKGQPATTQDLLLGRTRAKLFRSGQVPIEGFVGRDYQPLTIRQLEARYGLTL